METHLWKDEWRCVCMDNGEQCAIMAIGISMMPL